MLGACMALVPATGCVRTLTEAELIDLRGEVGAGNDARYHAARAALQEKGYVFTEEWTTTHFVAPRPSLRHDVMTLCMAARRGEDAPPLALRLFERVEGPYLAREDVTAPAADACAFLNGGRGSLTITLPDGSSRDLERMDEHRWVTATSPEGERFVVRGSARQPRVRTVRVDCEHRTPELRQTPLSTGEQVPFRYRDEPVPKELILDYEVEHVEDVCG